MNIRFLVLPLLVFMSIFYSVYGCVYLEDHQSCDFKTDQGLNIITINTQSIGDYNSIEASITTPKGEMIPLEFLDENEANSQLSFSQSRILDSFGVYEINIKTTLKDSVSTIEDDFTLLYDNSNPLPPVVEEITQLSISGGSLRIEGFVNNPEVNEKVIIYKDGAQVEEVLVNGGDFESVFNVDAVNKISLQTKREDGKLSSKYSFIHYSDDINFDNVEPARVTNVDFESTNELVKKTSSTIYSFSPHYHISGRASNGNVVFIQGVPIPVINGNFESFLLLNEGEENVCVRGTNSVCNSITTIYSYEATNYNLDLLDINSININSLQGDDFVEQLNVQGEFTNSFSQAGLTSTPVNRNLYFMEFFYPGVYEKKYMLIDREDPEIEIMTPKTLYPSSTIGIYLNDDVGINLETLEITIADTQYSINDVINSELLGKVKYLEFPTPVISSGNEEIIVSVEDTDGKLVQKTKSAEFKGALDSNLQVDILGNKVIGDTIFISQTDDAPLQLKIYNPLINTDSNNPIAMKSSQIDKQYISSYSINENNEITVTIEREIVANNSSLNLSVLVYDSTNSSSFDEFDIDFNIVKINRNLENEDEFKVIEKYVDSDLVIIELKNQYIDYSTLKVNGKTDNFFTKGDYLFMNHDNSDELIISYNDINTNYRSFSVNLDSSDITINNLNPSSDLQYLTYTLEGDQGLNYFDLLSSFRTSELEVIKSNFETHINPSFIEGTSVQELSFFTTNYGTSKFDTLIQEQFSYNNYPSIEVNDVVQFRGLKKFTNEDSIVVQGRILGSQTLNSVSIGGVDCSIKERFFICKNVDTSDFYNSYSVNINGETNNDSDDPDIEIINPSNGNSSILRIGENDNVFVSSEGYTFSEGDISFNFTPAIDGEHGLYINGELVKTFNIDEQNINELNINLLEEEYLNRDTIGSDLNVYVKDENNEESNSLSMRFTRILNAIISIVVS